MEMSSLCLGCKISSQYIWINQVETPPRISSPGSKIRTGQISPQFYVFFNDEFSTVPFMKEGTIPPNWKDLVQRISQSCAQNDIDRKDTWFNLDLEEDNIKTPTYVPRVTSEIPVSKGALVSEVIKHSFRGNSKHIKFTKSFFAQQSSNMPSGMPYSEGEKG